MTMPAWRVIAFAIGLGSGVVRGGDVPFVDAADGTIEVAMGFVAHVEARDYLVVVTDGDGERHVLEATLDVGAFVEPARLGRRAVVRARVRRTEEDAPRIELITVDHVLPEESAALLELRRLGVDCEQDAEGHVTRVDLHRTNGRGEPFPPHVVAHLAAFERLKNVSLGNVTDAGLLQLAPLTNLDVVSIGGEGVTGNGLAGLANSRNLTVLNTRLPDLADDGLRHLAAHENLWCLRLNGSRITSAGLAHLEKLVRLRILEVDDTRVGDAGLKHLAGMSELEYLFLAGTPITDDALAMIPDLGKLWALKLDRTAITNEGLSNFREFDSLKGVNFLYLARTRITDAGLAHLVDVERLEGIDVAGTGIGDTGLGHLATHAHLKWIHAPGCRISGTAAARFEEGRDRGFYITLDPKGD